MAGNALNVVILASGLSQRLGFAKQLIVKYHQSLLRENVQLALSLNPVQVLVVLPHHDSDFFNRLSAEISDLAVTVVKNSTPQTGMADSIKLAIATLKQQQADSTMRVLFLTTDQVALTHHDLIQLTQAVEHHQILASQYGDEPILGVPVNLPFGFLQEFGNELQGDKGLRSLWKHQTDIPSQLDNTVYQLFPIALPHLSDDIDTPQDFERLQDHYQLSLPKNLKIR